MNINILHLKSRIWCLKREPFHILLRLLRRMMALNDRICRFKMPIIKGYGVYVPQPQVTKIWMFKCVKSNSTTKLHAYNESANYIGSYTVHFNINRPSNLTEMVPVIGMEGIVSHTCLCYSRDHLTRIMRFDAEAHWIPMVTSKPRRRKSNSISFWPSFYVFVYISYWASRLNYQNRPHFEGDYWNWWHARYLM